MLRNVRILILLLVSLVHAAPPVLRLNKDDGVVDSPPDAKDSPIDRPLHLQAVPLERDGDINKEFRQEVLLGSDDTRDPEQLTILIKQMFYAADTNKDEFLSADELQRRIVHNTKAHLEESQQEAAKDMKAVDTDGDGKITWVEYLPHHLSEESKTEHKHAKEDKTKEASRVKDEEEAFKKADLDGDGSLDEKEWLGFLHPEHSKQSLMEMAAEIVKSYDKNEDGAISREEFIVAAPGEVEEQFKQMEKDEQKRREVEFDRDIDTNGDGSASIEEIFRYVDPSNEQHARKEVSEILSLADSDGDGLLSLTELLQRDWLLETSALIDANRRLHDDL